MLAVPRVSGGASCDGAAEKTASFGHCGCADGKTGRRAETAHARAVPIRRVGLALVTLADGEGAPVRDVAGLDTDMGFLSEVRDALEGGVAGAI